MKQGIFTILEHEKLTDTVYRMVLQGDTEAITASGQFVNLKLDGLYLRQVGGQAVLGRQILDATPWLTERHGYDPTSHGVAR